MAHLVEKTVSGIGSLKLTYGSNLDTLGIGSTALYGPNFPFKRSQSRVSCNIRMQSFQPSHNALHIKKHEAVMDYTDDFIWCCRNISTSDGIRVFAGAVDDIVGAAGIRAASMGSRPDNTAMFSGAKRSKPYNATVAILEAGTEVKWCSSNISSSHDHAAIVLDGAAVYRGKGKTLQKYRCRGPDLIVDDATLLIHEGVKAEEEFPNTGKLPDPESTTNLEFQKVDPLRYYGMKERLVGVSGETTTIVKRFNQMQDSGTLPFPAINVNGPFTKIKFDNLHGCRPSLPDGLMEAKDFMIAGKVAVGCGYGDVGKPFCAVQPLMEALPEDVFHTADIFVTTTSNKYIIMVDHMRKMKNNAIVCNIDLGEGPLMNLGCAYTGHPSFVMFCSFTKKAAYINVTAEGPYNTEEK